MCTRIIREHRHATVSARPARLISVIAMAAVFAGQPAWGQDVVIAQAEAIEIAREKGWLIRDASPTRTIELQSIVNGFPRYYVTHNLDAADSVSTDECWLVGSNGLGLTGTDVTLGIWDGGGVLMTHQEFGGRAIQMDSPSDLDDHATHVAGTMIASGVVAVAKGMSPAADLECRDWNDDEQEVDDAAAGGLLVSNHSYGLITGWILDNFGAGWGWYWFGDTRINEVEDYAFGFYDYQAADWDQLAFDHPMYLFVKSAGNDRNEGPSSGTRHWFFSWDTFSWEQSYKSRNRDGNNGYDSIAHNAVSKNGLTVGAVDDVIGGYDGPGSVAMLSFSCWGPTDDGRIKPDITGNGYFVYSSGKFWDNDYISKSGTSMAAPNVSGSLGLLIEHWRNTHPGDPDMRSATLKAVVLHTADEAGLADGPDYEYGWGLMNTLNAADLISTDVTRSFTITEQTLKDGETFELRLFDDGTGLRATICWTDPPGLPPAAAVDPSKKMLVNDLDLRIETDTPQAIHDPWVLDPDDPSIPATTGDNDTDNVEQVVVNTNGTGRCIFRVTHKGSLMGRTQKFSLIITGAITDCNSNGVPDNQDIAGGTSDDCNSNGTPDECELKEDCNNNGVLDECEPDRDGDGVPDDCDACPDHPFAAPNVCGGCEGPAPDADGDGYADCKGIDGCPNDPEKQDPGICGCGVSDDDSDGDGVPDCNDRCPNENDIDSDDDGVYNCDDLCPFDANKTEPGQCGCGAVEIDTDGDGTADCKDVCLDDPAKTFPGACGCGFPETDSDGDGVPDCIDGTPDGVAQSLRITGPGVVVVGEAAQYVAEVVYAGGTSEDVSDSDRVTWEVLDTVIRPERARLSVSDTISANGVLTVSPERDFETTLSVIVTFDDGPVELQSVRRVHVVMEEEDDQGATTPTIPEDDTPAEQPTGEEPDGQADDVGPTLSTARPTAPLCAAGMIMPLASSLLLLGFARFSRTRRSTRPRRHP